MRGIVIGLMLLLGTAAVASAEGGSAAMKALLGEMKTHADAEKRFREEKKSAMTGLEAQIDAIRKEAKAKGETKEPDSVKDLQLKRLTILAEVAERDVQSSEQGVVFAQKKLELAKENRSMFAKKRAEAEQSLALGA